MKKCLLFLLLWGAIVVSQAQSDCAKMLESAQKYYDEGKYEKAVRMIREMIQPNCKGYGDALLKKCNQKLQEAKPPQPLPNPLDAEEEAAYKRCTTEAGCTSYLVYYPNGRYADKVNRKLSELQNNRLKNAEFEVFSRCSTVSACNDYLSSYPNGVYYAEVSARKRRLEEERLNRESEAARTAYMRIRKIEFANYSKENKILEPYGFTMYASEIRYLKPRIIYDGILDEPKDVELFWKIVTPDGSVKSNSGSPYGFTGAKSFKINPGENNICQLSAWGTAEGGSYLAGDYRLEIWYEEVLIYQKDFSIREKENALSKGNWRNAMGKCSDFAAGGYKGLYGSNGQYSRLGMFVWENGDCYAGQWNAGKEEGDGVRMAGQEEISNCPRCKYYVGHYFNGKKSGFGICYDKLGRVIYYGDFADDMPVETYPKTGDHKNRFECFEYQGGNYFIGETRDGKPHGKGFYIWSNGNVWYGEWAYGERNGYGISMPCEGFVYEGKWKGNEEQ